MRGSGNWGVGMRKIGWWLAVCVALVAGCGGTDGGSDVTGDSGGETVVDLDVLVDTLDDTGRDVAVETVGDTVTDDGQELPVDAVADTTPPYWTDEPFKNDFEGFDRDDYEPVIGWILLDYNREKILADIETAFEYGVNHIQLSHDIIMDVDDLLGDDQPTADRVETINLAVEAAHARNMKVYLWAHEFQDGDIVVCYGPDGAIWETRSAAYRNALAKVPDVDGIILMFGSAGASPWFTLCDCDWCTDTFPDEMMPPPNDVKIQLVTEHIGDVLKNLDKEMVARVFAHEPEENQWHADGLARARNTEFISMHKSEVQDWQPYNPPDPTLGQVGSHPSILEMDAAGEYFGKSELPFASPIYYRYRLKDAFDKTAIGAVARISRGSDSALGTPNEVNLETIRQYIQNPAVSVDQVWSRFLTRRYFPDQNPEGNADATALKAVLELSLPVMTKTHYVLGQWALEKGSDIPTEPGTGELGGRGNMPKWNADWTEIWNRVKTPDYQTVYDIYNEGTEAVMLAETAFNMFSFREWNLEQDDYAALYRQLRHQYFAARAWRAVDTYIFARKSAVYFPENAPLMSTWADWARVELEIIADEMGAAGLSNVKICSPTRIRTFLSNTVDAPDIEPSQPLDSWLRPLYFSEIGSESLIVSIKSCMPGTYSIEYGTKLPHFDKSVHVANAADARPDCQEWGKLVGGLDPDTMYFFRLKVETDGGETLRTSEYWAMTNPSSLD